MECPVCNGTGVMALPHVPGSRGGWIDTTHSFSGMACGACRGTGLRVDIPADDTPPRTPSADEQLHAERQLLTYVLRYSRVFPSRLTDDWVAALDDLDVYVPTQGQTILAGFRHSFELAKQNHRPVRDVLSASPSNEMTFERETREVERHLGFLEALMDHAAAWLAEHPEDGRDDTP